MPNSPYLDASVVWRIKSGTLDLSEAGFRSTEESIITSGLAMEVVGLISSGKEADVYLALYNGSPIAIKVYRLYRTYHRGGRPVKLDNAGWLAAKEYEMTRQAWRGGARVPAPARRVENMFSMRYLGTEEGPAPRLNDVVLDDPEEFLKRVLAGLESLAATGVVHSDLSAFNILFHDGEPWFIDFSEAIRVDRTGYSPWERLQEATVAFNRGLSALRKYFGRYRVDFDSEPFVEKLVKSMDKFDVLD